MEPRPPPTWRGQPSEGGFPSTSGTSEQKRSLTGSFRVSFPVFLFLSQLGKNKKPRQQPPPSTWSPAWCLPWAQHFTGHFPSLPPSTLGKPWRLETSPLSTWGDEVLENFSPCPSAHSGGGGVETETAAARWPNSKSETVTTSVCALSPTCGSSNPGPPTLTVICTEAVIAEYHVYWGALLKTVLLKIRLHLL